MMYSSKHIYIWLLIFVILLSNASCNKKQEICEFNSECDTLSVNKELLYHLGQYIKKHPQYNSLTVITDFEYNWRDENKGSQTLLILIGPSLEHLFEERRIYPSTFFTYKHKVIFIQSSLDRLCNQNMNVQLYNKYCVRTLNVNSNIILYLKEATAISITKDGVLYHVTEKADTLILKKMVKFVPPSPQ